jgi:hypothetical protein
VGSSKEIGETSMPRRNSVKRGKTEFKINLFELPPLCRVGHPKELGETGTPLQTRVKRRKTEFKINPYEVC